MSIATLHSTAAPSATAQVWPFRWFRSNPTRQDIICADSCEVMCSRGCWYILAPPARFADSPQSSQTVRIVQDRARSREIDMKTPDALYGSVYRKIAQVTSPKRRQCPPTTEMDENGGRRRTYFGPPLPAPRPGQATHKSNEIGLVLGCFVKSGAF